MHNVASIGLTEAFSRVALPTPTWRTNSYGHTHPGLQDEPKKQRADRVASPVLPTSRSETPRPPLPWAVENGFGSVFGLTGG